MPNLKFDSNGLAECPVAVVPQLCYLGTSVVKTVAQEPHECKEVDLQE